jgi:dephospho-CoA kinase
VVHELYESPDVRDAVVNRFGPEVMDSAGPGIDRGALAGKAFASDEGRRWLEELLWPRVGARMMAWRRDQERADPPPRALVVEVPLLFESGLDRGYDATIAVIADEAVRHERASGRGHQALDERTARQLTQEEKSQRATYTVVNDGTEAELESKLSAILDTLDQ